MIPRTLIAAAATAITLSWTSASRADPLEPLRAQWRSATDYAPVLTALLAWRSSHPWSAEVDYMIGTAACRTQAHHDLGKDVLRLLAECDIGSSARQVVLAEHAACAQAHSTPPHVGWSDAVRAVAGVSGKYWSVKIGDAADDKTPVMHERLSITNEAALASAKQRLIPRTGSLDLTQLAQKVHAAFPSWDHRPRVWSSAGFVVWAKPGEPATTAGLAKHLDDFETFLVQTYGAERPAFRINVYLAESRPAALYAARSLHGLEFPSGFIGYSSTSDESVLIVDRFGRGTAFHEATHLILRSNFANIPPWVDEGVASLYEHSTVSGGIFRGLPNFRQALLRAKGADTRLLATVALSWKDIDEQQDDLAIRYAMARSLALYLQDKGKLGDVVRAVRTSRRDLRREETDTMVLLRTMGATEEELEADFARWLDALPLPPPTRVSDDDELPDLCHSCGCLAGPDAPSAHAPIEQRQECGPDVCQACTQNDETRRRLQASRPGGCTCDVRARAYDFDGAALLAVLLLGAAVSRAGAGPHTRAPAE